MLLLGLGGKPRSGKTIAAEALGRAMGAKIYSYSDLICQELGVRREDVKDARILQDHGQRRRAEDPHYWSKRIEAAIFEDMPRVAVIPNIRTFEEIPMVRGLGGFLVRYTRLNPDGSLHICSDRDMNHALETTLDLFNWDFHITAKCGQKRLVEAQTIALANYLESLQGGQIESPEEHAFSVER